MLPDVQPSTSTANWRVEVQRPRLITPINLVGLLVAVVIVLLLLHPQQRLSEQIKLNDKVDEVSLQYIKNLLATEPNNIELRIQLAHAYASIGQYDNAINSLPTINSNTEQRWREEALIVKLDILSKIAFSAKAKSNEHKNKLAEFKQALRKNESQISLINTLRPFALLAEAGGDLPLAERTANRIYLATNNLADLDEAARLSLANGHYLASAQYTWRARQVTPEITQKYKYIKLALSTLQAGGLGTTGLNWARELPASEWQHPDVLYNLTKLALASNRPATASTYAVSLVGFDSSISGIGKINSDYVELAYAAFLGNGDLHHALKLAQISVRQYPDNILWRERLAQVSEWAKQPTLAAEQWRWLALNRGKDSDWQTWMRLAVDLFDYDAQIIGLERDWKLNSNNETYARKLVQLYEYLGKPEDALEWLDRKGDKVKHPELILISAELLTHMGRDEEALTSYRHYLKHHIASPDQAVTIAALMQRAGLYQEAFNVLILSKPQARAANKMFWENLGELAWILKNNDEATIAYRYLSNVPDAELHHQLRLFQVLKQANPRLAAQTAEQYWQKNGRIDLFLNAAETYATLNDWLAVQRLYKFTDGPKWRDFDKNLQFVSIRAEMNRKLGNLAAAENDFRFLAARYPDDFGIKETYLWLLIDAHKFNQLDVLMQRWSNLLTGAPNLWDVFAAGHLVLGRPNQALILYERMEKSRSHDDLWLLNYAATLDAVGQTKRGGQIRNKIWQKRLSTQTNRDWLNTRANANDIEALRLLLLNDPTLGQGILWKLLRDGSQELKQNSQFIELATVWLNEHDQNDASRAWLIRQYARRLNTSP